jgi:hypothetical protein
VTNLNYPYYWTAQDIFQQHPDPSFVLTQSSLMGGHLRLLHPDTPVAIPGKSKVYHDATPESLLVVWEKGSNWRNDRRLFHLVNKVMGENIIEVEYPAIQEPFKYLPGRTLRVSSALLEYATVSKN